MHVKRWFEWVSHNGLLKQALNIVGQVASKVNSPKIKMDQARFVDFVESSLNVQIVQYASSNTDSVTNVTTHRLSPMPQNSALQMQNRHSIAPHGTPHVLVFALCWTIEGSLGHNSPSMIVWLFVSWLLLDVVSIMYNMYNAYFQSWFFGFEKVRPSKRWRVFVRY
jgi:hypothetical protein